MRILSSLSFLIIPFFVHAQQGAVTFANGASIPIRHAATGTNINARVVLYGSTQTGLGSDASLVQIGAVIDTFAPGLFSGGTRNIGNPGDTVTLQVRAWTGSSATWEEAFAGMLVDPSILISIVRTMWEQPVGGGVNPTQPIFGPGRFQGLELGVPEPSSVALAAVGGVLFLLSLRNRVARR